MAQVIITINNREYAIVCENGEEGHIIRLANILDRKARELTKALGQINENHLLAMTGLLIADELTELKKSTSSPTSQSMPTGISEETLAEIDNELANLINSLENNIKTIAQKIKSI